MKIIKRLISIVMILSVLSGMLVFSTSAGAASNDVNAFKSGKLVQCGKYLFTSVYNEKSYTYKIYRTKTDGSGKKAIANAMGDSLYTYKNMVFFNTKGGIYYYNVNKGKCVKFTNNNYSVAGICTKGIISSSYNTGLTLIQYNKKIRYIASSSSEYMCSTNKYVFYYSVDHVYNNYYTYIYRYSLSKNNGVFVSKVLLQCSYDIYPEVQDSHIFKNCIIFNFGRYEGSGGYYYGDTYKMNTSGKKVKKIISNTAYNLTPGKNCVYAKKIMNGGDKSYCYQITSSGKCVNMKKATGVYYTTKGNYGLFNIKAKNSSIYNLYKKPVTGGKYKKIISTSSLIYKSDPSDAFGSIYINGAVNNMILTGVTIKTYQGSTGWRGRTLRTYMYLINAKTGKKYLLDKS